MRVTKPESTRRRSDGAERNDQALKPTYAQAHYSLGLVYASLNDKDGFTREFAILKRLDPKLADQLYNAVKQ